jgi:hypothetical protein
MAAATVLIAVATVLSFGSVTLQWLELKRADFASQRAWIAPIRFTLANPLDSDKQPVVRIGFQNVGREPAVNVRNILHTAHGDVVVTHDTDFLGLRLWSLPLFKPETSCDEAGKQTANTVVYPSQLPSPSYSTEVEATNTLTAANLRIGHGLLIVFGCFVYDTVNETRHSAFCEYLGTDLDQTPATWQFRACPVGNKEY